MHIKSLNKWQHHHQFDQDSSQHERNTISVVLLTFVMMVVELIAGYSFGSMSLLADGWHMGTHVAALSVTVLAYRYARHRRNDPRFTFGTGKVSDLGGFASATTLAIVAVIMVLESTERFFTPSAIQFDEAIGVAIVGLLVNLACAILLRENPRHTHGDDREHRHQDHNLRAAYLHVIADAMTSILAIFALLVGKLAGWVWVDPLMGIVGSMVIMRWSYGLLRDTGRILLDSGVNKETISSIQTLIEEDSDNRVVDLHVWKVGSHQLAAIISLVTHFPKQPDYYKQLLHGLGDLQHISIEVNHHPGKPCIVTDPLPA